MFQSYLPDRYLLRRDTTLLQQLSEPSELLPKTLGNRPAYYGRRHRLAGWACTTPLCQLQVRQGVAKALVLIGPAYS